MLIIPKSLQEEHGNPPAHQSWLAEGNTSFFCTERLHRRASLMHVVAGRLHGLQLPIKFLWKYFFSWHLWMTYVQERLTEQHLTYSLFYSSTKILAAPCSCFSHKKLHPAVKAANLTPSFFGIRAAVHISTVIIQSDVACYCTSVTTAAK